MSNIYEIGSEDFAGFGSLENQQGLDEHYFGKMNTVEAKMYLDWICHKAEQYAVVVVYYA